MMRFVRGVKVKQSNPICGLWPYPDRVALSKQDCDQLAKAANVLFRLRELMENVLGEDARDTTDIALAGYTCEEIAGCEHIEFGGIR